MCSLLCLLMYAESLDEGLENTRCFINTDVVDLD